MLRFRKVMGLVMALMLLCLSASAERFVFGQSEMGRNLECVRIGDGEKRMLVTFALHGFEDHSFRDGAYLVEIAENLIAHYEANPDRLGDYTLYVAPCVNPDGVAEGQSKDGFGRLNANGLDINRDFPEGWKRMTTPRYRTGDAPFATVEARAVQSLADQIQPHAAVDVHGWINRVYGHKELSQCFMNAFGFKHHKYNSGGKLSQWMETRCEAAVLVELPDRPTREGYVQDCAQKLIQALDQWFAQSAE